MTTRSGARVAGAVSVALLLSACVTTLPTTGIVKVSPDTYRLSRVDSGGQYADAAAMKASVLAEADAYAKSQGKVLVPLSTHEETMRVGHLSTIEYEFRLVAPGDETAKPASPPSPPVVVEQKAAAPAASEPAAKASGQPDLYTELIRLDDLRKRGILTEDEFQTLKAKLLAGK